MRHLISGCLLAVTFFRPLAVQQRPLVDYHQHLFSPAAAKIASGVDPVTASDLIALLDAAGIVASLYCQLRINSPIPTSRPSRGSTSRSRLRMIGPADRWWAIQIAFADCAVSTHSKTMPSRRLRAVQRIRTSARVSSCTLATRMLTWRIRSTSNASAACFGQRTTTGWRLWLTCDRR